MLVSWVSVYARSLGFCKGWIPGFLMRLVPWVGICWGWFHWVSIEVGSQGISWVWFPGFLFWGWFCPLVRWRTTRGQAAASSTVLSASSGIWPPSPPQIWPPPSKNLLKEINWIFFWQLSHERCHWKFETAFLYIFFHFSAELACCTVHTVHTDQCYTHNISLLEMPTLT